MLAGEREEGAGRKIVGHRHRDTRRCAVVQHFLAAVAQGGEKIGGVALPANAVAALQPRPQVVEQTDADDAPCVEHNRLLANALNVAEQMARQHQRLARPRSE